MQWHPLRHSNERGQYQVEKQSTLFQEQQTKQYNYIQRDVYVLSP